eukprot:CAMPEP_0183720306 /NCGR_PEP_ID=MMETSP0737-20130205/12958_1 /TAXON_ID=385413 /ORGANISM="Thalassiosira miniscula, Strain CCMP1093" /LENGTH=53 /DNA_ID=CAMNT_0025950151 /DNA_START=499 /DNA_END=660 /DNA_ORIENTATION=-
MKAPHLAEDGDANNSILIIYEWQDLAEEQPPAPEPAPAESSRCFTPQEQEVRD